MNNKIAIYSADNYITANFFTEQAFASAKANHLRQLPVGEQQIKLCSNLKSQYLAIQMLQKQLIFQRFPNQQLVIELTADDDYTGLNALFLSVIVLGLPVRFSLFCARDGDSLGVFQYKIRQFSATDSDVNVSQTAGSLCHGCLGTGETASRWDVGQSYDDENTVSSQEAILVKLLQVELGM